MHFILLFTIYILKFVNFTGRLFKQSQREVIQRFRQLHLSQQSLERQYLDLKKIKALERDEAGNPIRALFFADGMTQFTCQTPKLNHFSKGDRTIESRIVGVEVYCSPVKTVFVYRTDALVGGGANIMIEIMRQAMIDLCGLLRRAGLKTPKTCWYQFDNCGENKNKEMFAYISLLIECYIFDEIEVCFLIVGHTHASIDQYFSVISKAIKKAYFIGSPLALLELIRRAHMASWEQDPIVREIVVYYDIKKALGPYINKKIKYYQVPHCFLFKPSFGRRATMQYKMFSGNLHWLPQAPNIIDSVDKSKSVNTIELPANLAVVNGEQRLLEYLGWNKNIASNEGLGESILNDRQSIHALTSVDDVIKDLKALDNKIIAQQELRMNDEADGIEVGRYVVDYKVKIQKEMNKASNAEKGFIMWLEYNATNSLSPIEKLCPVAFDPRPVLDQLEALRADDNLVDVDDFREEVDAANIHPHSHRRPSNGATGNSSLSPAHKKLYNAAKDIAGTSGWVLKQIGNKILRGSSHGFNEKSFLSNVLTLEEIEYYQQRNSIEKVIRYAADLYTAALATPWEPLPIGCMNAEEIELMEAEKLAHRERIDAANKIGTQLLVRVGHNAEETQQIVDYGVNISFIGDALRTKRGREVSKAGSANKKSKTEELYVCDVIECEESAKSSERCCDVKACMKYRFCSSLHLQHESHSYHKKKLHRTKFVQTTTVSNTSVPTTINNSLKTNNNNINGDNNTNSNDNSSCAADNQRSDNNNNITAGNDI